MGHQSPLQPKLFYNHVNLDKRVPQTHTPRTISEKITFDFIHKEVKDAYGENGNVSGSPPVRLAVVSGLRS